MNKTILSLIMIIPNIASAENFAFFKEDIFFKPLIAYSRSVINEVSITKTSDVKVVDGSLGLDIPIITLYFNDFKLQFGSEAATWLTLEYPSENVFFPLLTQDFYFGFPLSIKYKNFVGVLKVSHVSAHRGDGAIKPEKAIKYSRDSISVHIDHRHSIKNTEFRIYTQGGYAFNITPSRLESWYLGSGIEINQVFIYMDTLFAIDMTYNADVSSLDIGLKLAFFSKYKVRNLFSIGLFTSVYAGSNRRGQLVGSKTTEIRAGIIMR